MDVLHTFTICINKLGLKTDVLKRVKEVFYLNDKSLNLTSLPSFMILKMFSHLSIITYLTSAY